MLYLCGDNVHQACSPARDSHSGQKNQYQFSRQTYTPSISMMPTVQEYDCCYRYRCRYRPLRLALDERTKLRLERLLGVAVGPLLAAAGSSRMLGGTVLPRMRVLSPADARQP